MATDSHHFYRKPNPGMALQAAKDFPSIDLSKTIMVGNKLSDMQFGRNAGTYTVYLKTTHPEQVFPHADIDLILIPLLILPKLCKILPAYTFKGAFIVITVWILL